MVAVLAVLKVDLKDPEMAEKLADLMVEKRDLCLVVKLVVRKAKRMVGK
jgi:hypothetical protein